MLKVTQSAEFSSRLKLLISAVVSLGLGLGMIFFPYRLFGILMTLLPWVLLLSAAGKFAEFIKLRQQRKKYFVQLVFSILLTAAGAMLLYFTHWRDIVLWYIFAGYLFVSAYITMRPVWQPGVEKQIFARSLGALTVWGFALLLLFMPRSGLSEALQLLGIFTAAWGVFQLLLPPVEH